MIPAIAFFFSRYDDPPVDQTSLSRLHDHIHTHSVGLLWTSDQPVAENFT